MKFKNSMDWHRTNDVAPYGSAWIEMLHNSAWRNTCVVAPFTGERGLKFCNLQGTEYWYRSLPSRSVERYAILGADKLRRSLHGSVD